MDDDLPLFSSVTDRMCEMQLKPTDLEASRGAVALRWPVDFYCNEGLRYMHTN